MNLETDRQCVKLICNQEGEATPVNIFALSNRLKNDGRTRLLPSLRRHGSAGALPSRLALIFVLYGKEANRWRSARSVILP